MGYLVRVLCTILSCLCFYSTYAQLHGQALVDSLVKEVSIQDNDTTKLNLMADISWECMYVNPEMGVDYGQKMVELARTLGIKSEIARGYSSMGHNYRIIGEYQNAIASNEKALKVYREAGNKKGVAAVTCNLGVVYNDKNDHVKGLSYLIEALRLDEEGGYHLYAAKVASNIGGIYWRQSNFDKAIEYSQKALQYCEEQKNMGGVIAITKNLGSIYEGKEDYETALEYFLKDIVLCDTYGDKEGFSRVSLDIGRVYGLKRDYVTALNYYSGAVEVAKEVGSRLTIGLGYLAIGKLFLSIYQDSVGNLAGIRATSGNVEVQQKKYLSGSKRISIPDRRSEQLRQALYYLNLGLDKVKGIDNPKALVECYTQLTLAYKLSGQYKEAYNASQNSYALSDSIFSRENKEKVLKLTLKNEYSRQRLTDSLKVAEDQKIARINLKKQKSYTYAGIAGVLLLGGFSFFVFKERRKSESERKKSDGLLLNILPEAVAEELKANGVTSAKHYDNVTVLFTDFVNFTQASESMNPQALIDELHTCFKKFDEITNKYGIEKIKTIGDAYLAAAGLPTADPEHALHVVSAAKEITDFMSDRLAKLGRERTFEVRVGIHSGSVVAGVVGVKKFAYDIWGDTVNTAARMEQNSEAGKINISQTTYDLVRDKITCEYRGEVEAKGKGVMKMYYVSA